ncbi:MAG: hypothetical protein MUP16_07535 [Sedimentisphaerales bacterium]|nr:hypothetical protein [Sedimentisphaerales bacterium]
MKQLLFLLGCAVLLSALAGCQSPTGNNSGVEVFVKDGGEFPQFLVGRWEANKKNDLNYWRIVFEPNGAISSVVIPLGEVEVRPNQTTEAQGPKGEPGFFEAGNFQVYYNPQSREFSVNIKIKQFYLERVLEWNVILKGSWEYFIVGDVSEDGKTWAGDVFSSPDITVLEPDPNSTEDKSKFKETAKLRIDFGDEGEEHLIFTKVPDVNASSNK